MGCQRRRCFPCLFFLRRFTSWFVGAYVGGPELSSPSLGTAPDRPIRSSPIPSKPHLSIPGVKAPAESPLIAEVGVQGGRFIQLPAHPTIELPP